MLIIGRKRDQKIVISDDIEITVLEIGRNRVRFGIQAPKDVQIHTKLKELPPASTKEVSAQVSPDAESVPPEKQVQTFQAVAGRGPRSGSGPKPGRPKSLKPL